MGFASGSVSFRRFAVIGKQPEVLDQAVLDKLDEFALKEREIGLPEEEEYGWSGGRHIFDAKFSFEHNVFAEALFCGLRLDSNKVPGQLKKAWEIIEEEAVAKTNPSGFITKSQKKEVKETVRKKMEEELRSGRFRKSKLLPLLWDLPTATLYCGASGKSQEKLMEIFERTFGLQLEPLSAGSIALRTLEDWGKRREYEDLKPTRFVQGPEGEGQVPEYPWVAKGPQPKDFLGNEFLLWLWHELVHHNGEVKLTTDSPGIKDKSIAVLMDKSLDLDCAYGMTGKDSLRCDGVSQMPEAMDALRSGKLPRKLFLIAHANGMQFEFNFNGESFGFGSGKLPEIEEAENPRVLFEERIPLIRQLCGTTDALFHTFLKIRTGGGWESAAGKIRKWVLTTSRPVTAAVA